MAGRTRKAIEGSRPSGGCDASDDVDHRLLNRVIRVGACGLLVLTAPVGVLVVLVAHTVPRTLAGLETGFTRWLPLPTATARLMARVERLTETRSEALDASAVELHRIERALHDGAQARLVAVAMQLGLAEDLLDSDPAAARALVVEARTDAHTAMTELRGLVREMRPPLLADRGIDAALQALALDSPVRVDLHLHLARRLAPPVELAVYCTAAEALTNAVEHSGADLITLTVSEQAGRVFLRIDDDGRGGALLTRGTGLAGIARRLAAFDGTLHVTSPPGGPTVVEAELRCAS